MEQKCSIEEECRQAKHPVEYGDFDERYFLCPTVEMKMFDCVCLRLPIAILQQYLCCHNPIQLLLLVLLLAQHIKYPANAFLATSEDVSSTSFKHRFLILKVRHLLQLTMRNKGVFTTPISLVCVCVHGGETSPAVHFAEAHCKRNPTNSRARQKRQPHLQQTTRAHSGTRQHLVATSVYSQLSTITDDSSFEPVVVNHATGYVYTLGE